MHTLHLLEIRASKSELVMNLNVPCKFKKWHVGLPNIRQGKYVPSQFPSHARNTPPWVNMIATIEKGKWIIETLEEVMDVVEKKTHSLNSSKHTNELLF